jgi:hypothetical protein
MHTQPHADLLAIALDAPPPVATVPARGPVGAGMARGAIGDNDVGEAAAPVRRAYGSCMAGRGCTLS